MRSSDPALYLEHIIESAELAIAYLGDTNLVQFSDDQQLQDAVVRRLEIIGEAVKQLPSALRDENGDVPWRRIAGLRDKVVHDYMGVDDELVWRVVRQELPALVKRAREMLESVRRPPS